MITKEKTATEFFRAQSRINKIRVLFLKKRISHSEAVIMLINNNYGPQGAERAICYLESLAPKAKKKYLENIGANTVESILKKFDNRRYKNRGAE